MTSRKKHKRVTKKTKKNSQKKVQITNIEWQMPALFHGVTLNMATGCEMINPICLPCYMEPPTGMSNDEMVLV